MMSLSNSAVYIQFHPLVYLVKLHIEMNFAELIAKIVRTTNQLNECRDIVYNAEVTNINSNSDYSCRAAQINRGPKSTQPGTIERAPGFIDIEDILGVKSTREVASKSCPDLESGDFHKRFDSISDDEDVAIEG